MLGKTVLQRASCHHPNDMAELRLRHFLLYTRLPNQSDPPMA